MGSLGLAIFILIIYFALDVHYYIRGVFTVIYAKYFKKKIGFLEGSTMEGIVLPSDGDFYLTHMNNSRPFREFDFARLDNNTRTGFGNFDIKTLDRPIIAAHCMRYRQPLWMFAKFKIFTAPVYWDSNHVYFEQKIITEKDGIIRCLGYSKISYKTNVEDKIRKCFPNVVKPQIPDDLYKWIEYNNFSSQKLIGMTRSLLSHGIQNES